MKISRLACPALLPCLVAACGSPPEVPCDPTAATCQIAHDYGTITVTAGQEVSSLCYSWTLNNATDLWVSAVEAANDGAFHHSNWFFVPDNVYQHDDGHYPCKDIKFDEVNAALIGGVLFAQSTQARSETQRFAGGAVLHVPAYARIIGSTHLLNASAQAVTTGFRMTLDTLPMDQAKVLLTPFRLAYYDLHISPMGPSQFTGTCDLASAFAAVKKGPFAMKLYFVLPHYHVLGDYFQLKVAGGPQDGQVLDELHNGIGETLGHTFDPPVDLGAASGLTFTCGYDNPRAQEVQWGIGDQEMCEMLGFAESPVVYDASVDQGAVVGQGPSGPVNSGDCGVAAYLSFP